ncbi:MAG: leucine-rich repeat domain-containing protein, partial [Oscillospiraceae bacterium]|nr:leucine-rich repeat domain-containing protein [Oscillospiraceae bacterium]
MTSVSIGNGVTSIDCYTFQDCSSLESVTIPDSVQSIGGMAFENCSILTSVDIPDSVESIRYDAFYSCSSLQSINVSGGNANYKSEDGVLFSKDGANLIQYLAGKTDTSYSIPDSVQSIGWYAFYDCSSLTSVTYKGISEPKNPSSVFYDCTSLTSVDVPTNYEVNTFCGKPVNKIIFSISSKDDFASFMTTPAYW